MVGAVLIVIAMLVVLPTSIFVGGAIWSALIGETLSRSVAGGITAGTEEQNS